MNTIHNVRWVLHDYDETVWETIDINDVICNFGTFKTPSETEQRELTIFDYQLDKFKNLNNPNRKGFAHLIHKNTPDWGWEFVEQFGSTEIPHYNGKESLEEIPLSHQVPHALQIVPEMYMFGHQLMYRGHLIPYY